MSNSCSVKKYTAKISNSAVNNLVIDFFEEKAGLLR